MAVDLAGIFQALRIRLPSRQNFDAICPLIQPKRESFIYSDDARRKFLTEYEDEPEDDLSVRKGDRRYPAPIRNTCEELGMYDVLLKKWVQFRHCDEGVTLVEYGIALVLAVTVGTGTLLLLECRDSPHTVAQIGRKTPQQSTGETP